MYQESHKIELSKEFPGNKCLWWNYNQNGIASQIIYALLPMSASSDRGKQVDFHSPVGGVHHTSRFCQQGEGNIQQETGDGKLKLIVNQSEDGDHWDLCILYKGLTYLLWEKKLEIAQSNLIIVLCFAEWLQAHWPVSNSLVSVQPLCTFEGCYYAPRVACCGFVGSIWISAKSHSTQDGGRNKREFISGLS